MPLFPAGEGRKRHPAETHDHLGENWPTATATGISPAAAAYPGELRPSPPAESAPASSGGSSSFDVAIDSASIEGRHSYHRDLGADTEQKVENVNVDLAMGSL